MASIYKIATGWRAQVRVKGKQISGVFPTKAAALNFAREQETLLHKSNSPDPYMKFERIVSVYLESSGPGSDTKERIIARLLQFWGSWRLHDITPAAITAYATKRTRDGLAASTVTMEIGFMSTILRHGGVLCGSDEALLARERLASTMVTLRHLGMVGASNERKRRPTEGELDALVTWFDSRPRCKVPVSDIVLLALCTCCRVGELVGPKGIKVEDFLPDERAIWVRDRKSPRTKKANDDKIPLLKGPVTFREQTVDPVEIITRQPSIRSGHGPIFPFLRWSAQAMFSVGCKELGIEDLHFHDLRHDGISRLFEAGYDIPRVALVSGHKTWKNLQRYTHIDPASLHRDM